MRLFLDAQISARAVARPLRKRSHDVRAADEERELDGWEDEQLLELARVEGRIVVTFNVRDFPAIAGEWAGAGQHHAGCLVIVGIDHSEFGLTVGVIEAALAGRPEREAWRDYLAWGTRARG